VTSLLSALSGTSANRTSGSTLGSSQTAVSRLATSIETVGLMVSELASNCVRHTDSRFDLSIILTAREIRVEATDHGGGEPCLRSPAPTDPTGRGLFIVDTLAAAWGVEHRDASGKTVWFAVASDSPRLASQSAPSISQPAS
jgi:anti-sigma regulatory factor (Ser/Thr protein kinase)